MRRQHQEWQRAATKELATGGTEAALGRYAAAGMVEARATRAEARTALVEGWDAARQTSPDESSVMLAYTRIDVRELNDLARARMRQAGELGEDRSVGTERGERAFATGDRIMFLRNERGLGVKNGTLGMIERVDGIGMAVRLDGAERREVTFDLKDYAHVDHGYAATVHKAQGVTVDRAHVLATPHMDRHAAYVGLTRHRKAVSLHYGRDDFRDGRDLAWHLGRERAKDTTLDYEAGFAERRGIIPRSEIIVPEQRAERAVFERLATAEPVPERSAVRRGVFAGLKLRGSADEKPGVIRDNGVERMDVPRNALAGLGIGRDGEAEVPRPVTNERDEAVAGYAKAFADAERMRAAKLPVLPHQEIALGRAGERLDAVDQEAGRDLRSALELEPGLAARASTGQGRAALTAALEREGQVRQDPALRAERYVERWRDLEKASREAAAEMRSEAQEGMRSLAGAIKRDPDAEAVMKSRADDLGIEPGSRLKRVMDASSEREAMRLGRSQGLSR